MIRGSELIGRTVVDMEAATRLGKIKQVIVERDGERVAGFVLSHGETIVGTGGTRRVIPASALHAIGPDAITMRSVNEEKALAELDQLPRMSDIVGRKMVTRGGRLLGLIDDLLIEGVNGKVIGFTVGEGVRNKLENIFQSDRSKVRGYVRADADLQVGDQLIVVPDDALIEGEPDTGETKTRSGAPESEKIGSSTWAEPAPGDAPRRSIWTRRTEAPAPGPAEIPVETPAGSAVSNVNVVTEEAMPQTRT